VEVTIDQRKCSGRRISIKGQRSCIPYELGRLETGILSENGANQ